MNKILIMAVLGITLSSFARVIDLPKAGETPETTDLVAEVAAAKTDYDTSGSAYYQDPVTIRLAAGTYSLPTEAVVLDWPVTVCGSCGNAEEVIVVPTVNAFALNHASAWLHSLTVRGGAVPTSGTKSIIQISTAIGNASNGGTVSNVVVRSAVSLGKNCYPVVYVRAKDTAPALITHCKIVDNVIQRQQDNGNNRGGALWVYTGAGAVVRNTLIAGNVCTNSQTKTVIGEMAMVSMAAGTMLNCSVVDNIVRGTGAATCCAGVRAASENVKIVNTLVCGNTSVSGGDHYQAWSGQDASFVNCSFDLTTEKLPAGTDCLSVMDPKFLEPGDYRIGSDSPCRDKGLVSSDYDYGATDLAGSPRLVGGKIDIGAYQYNGMASSLSAVQVVPSILFDHVEVSFTAIPGGALGDMPTYYWDFDSDGVTDYVTDSPVFTRNFGLGVWRATVSATNDAIGVGNRYVLPEGFTVTPHPVHYVDVNGKNPQSPYLTVETAATDIKSALDVAVAGAEVVIAKGVYEISSSLQVTNDALVVRGATGNPEDVIVRAVASTRCLQVDAGSRALVHSLVLENGKGKDGIVKNDYYCAGLVLNVAHTGFNNGGAEVIYEDGKGGTVSNCVIRGGTFPGNYCVRSAGAFLHGTHARLTHCVVSNNTHTGSTLFGGYCISATGVALWNGACAENCLVAGNTSGRSQNLQAAVVVGGEGSLLRYSTVVSNKCATVGGVNVSKGGRFEKCVIALNSGVNTAARRAVWGAFDYSWNDRYPSEDPGLDEKYAAELEQAPLVAASQTTNACDVALADVGLGAGTISASVGQMFVDAGAGVWMPSRRSPLIDVVPFGNETQMPACDLAGGNRRSGNGFDLGAYERQKRGLVITFR